MEPRLKLRFLPSFLYKFDYGDFMRNLTKCCWILGRIFLIFWFSDATKRENAQSKAWYFLRELPSSYHILFSVLSLSLLLLVWRGVENWWQAYWYIVSRLYPCFLFEKLVLTFSTLELQFYYFFPMKSIYIGKILLTSSSEFIGIYFFWERYALLIF